MFGAVQQTGDVELPLPAGADTIQCLDWNPQGNMIAGGGWDNKARNTLVAEALRAWTSFEPEALTYAGEHYNTSILCRCAFGKYNETWPVGLLQVVSGRPKWILEGHYSIVNGKTTGCICSA